MGSEHQAGQHIQVEVAYALPDVQVIVPVEVEEGATVREAIERSGLLERFPDINLEQGNFGIFGKVVALDRALQSQERVEIYRPLIADPKEVRKQRAAEGKKMTKGGSKTTDA